MADSSWLVSATTLFVFLAAHARARIISSRRPLIGTAEVSLSTPFHDIGWSSFLTELFRHESHEWVDVFEENLIALAEIIQAFLPIWRAKEAMFGTFSIAGKTIIAFAAISRQRIVLVLAELPLLARVDQRAQRILDDVAEFVLRINVVIARIEIAVVFNRQRRTTSLTKDAEALLDSQPALQSDIKNLHEVPPDIVSNPFIKNGAEELAELGRLYRPGRDPRRAIGIRSGQNEAVGSRCGRHPFHNGNELHEATADFLEEAVNLKRMVRIVALDDGKRVELDLVFLEIAEPAYHLVKCWAPTLIDPVFIVKLARTI